MSCQHQVPGKDCSARRLKMSYEDEILGWRFSDIRNGDYYKKRKGFPDVIPHTFDDQEHYSNVFALLACEELRAQAHSALGGLESLPLMSLPKVSLDIEEHDVYTTFDYEAHSKLIGGAVVTQLLTPGCLLLLSLEYNLFRSDSACALGIYVSSEKGIKIRKETAGMFNGVHDWCLAWVLVRDTSCQRISQALTQESLKDIVAKHLIRIPNKVAAHEVHANSAVTLPDLIQLDERQRHAITALLKPQGTLVSLLQGGAGTG